jgi:hypothetical protein
MHLAEHAGRDQIATEGRILDLAEGFRDVVLRGDGGGPFLDDELASR